jgi:hypothetical protein
MNFGANVCVGMCSRLLRPTAERDAPDARDGHDAALVGIVVFATVVVHSLRRVIDVFRGQ